MSAKKSERWARQGEKIYGYISRVELTRLQLDHFRSYPALEITLGPGLHIFAGANAQGKTNLLEAVYLTATGRSPRTHQDAELITWDADVARVTADYNSAVRGPFAVAVSLARRTPGSGHESRRGGPAVKQVKINGALRKPGDLAGLVPIVLFLIEDLDIVRGEPARRREFLDNDLSAMSRTYGMTLRQYQHVLEQRNRHLKDIRDGQASLDALAAWDTQLASYGGRVMEVRTRFIHDLNTVTGEVYRGLTASTQELSVLYRSEWAGEGEGTLTRDAYAVRLLDVLAEVVRDEVQRGTTLVGPHRDDLQFLVDGKDVRLYGSQGEQRTAALALRVAQFTLLQQLFGEPPVLLLDDILSELDRTRRAGLLEHLAPLAQVIMTTTDIDAMGLPPHADAHFYRVSPGQVVPVSTTE